MADPTAELLVKIGADTKGLKKGMDAAEKRVGGFANTIKKHHRAIGLAMTAMGAAILAAGALSVKQFASMGDEVQKMALRTGFSTEALSELRHAAELSGTSLAGLEKASRTLSGAILDAGFGLETYVRAFDKIGLSYEQLKPLSPEKQFIAVMEALANLTDESEKAALAADLFGRAGTALLPMLVDGAEGLAAMRQEAHDLGIVFDQEAANKAAIFTDAMTKLKGSFSGIMITIGGFVADNLQPMIDRITEVVKEIGGWMKENPELTKTIVIITGAVGALLLVLGPLLIMLPQLAAAYKILAAVKWAAIIPAIWAHVAALWAQVTATLAAMAATGVLIPAAIAAVAAIALLVTGITLLVKNQKKQYASTTAITDATKKASVEITALVASTNELADGTEAQGEAIEALAPKIEGLTDTYTGLELAIKGASEQAAKAFRPAKDPEERRDIVGVATGIKRAYEKLLETGAKEVRLWAGMVGKERLEELYGYYFKAPSVLRSFAGGGIVTKPTLALVGEKGPEAIIPLDKGMGGITINFNEPVFMEREESINKLADRIYRVIKREQRLSFGGAYSG